MFNKNLKSIRLKHGLSQKQVADYLCISPQSVSKWEKGEALPSIEYLPKLSQILKCDINAFFSLESIRKIEINTLKDFLFLVNDVNNNLDDVFGFIRNYPSIIEETIAFAQELMKQKTVQVKTIQSILSCSVQESNSIISSLIMRESLVKLDIEDAFYVDKNNFEDFIRILKMYQIVFEKEVDKSIL